MRVIAGLLLFFAIAASAQTPRTAVISYPAVTTRTDGSTITGAVSYEVWQGLKGASKIRIGTITSLQTTIDSGLVGGNEYCWHIIVREASNPLPSAPSNEVCKAFAQAAPNVVTITVI